MLHEGTQAYHVVRRHYPIPGVKCLLLRKLYGGIRLFNGLLLFDYAYLRSFRFSHLFSPLSFLVVLLVSRVTTRSLPRPATAGHAFS